MEARMRLYGADPLAEAKVEMWLEQIDLALLEIETFYNENHDERGRFAPSDSSGEAGPDKGSGSKSGSSGGVEHSAKDVAREIGGISAAGHAALEEVSGHLQSALDIVKGHTIEGALIKRIQNGIAEVQKGNARRKEESDAKKEEHKKEIESLYKLPSWRDTNPSKSEIGRAKEFLVKAANSLKIRFQRDPEFRKEVYKETAMVLTSAALHLFAPVPVKELGTAGHAAIEGMLGGVEAVRRMGMHL